MAAAVNAILKRWLQICTYPTEAVSGGSVQVIPTQYFCIPLCRMPLVLMKEVLDKTLRAFTPLCGACVKANTPLENAESSLKVFFADTTCPCGTLEA